jgi:hypothetical protein
MKTSAWAAPSGHRMHDALLPLESCKHDLRMLYDQARHAAPCQSWNVVLDQITDGSFWVAQHA